MTALGAGDRALLRVLDGAPAAMLVIDPAGAIAFANERAARLFGAARAALEGTQVEALLAPACRGTARDDLDGLFASPAGSRHERRRELDALGSAGPIPVELSMERLLAASAPLAIVLVRDLTEERRAWSEQAAALAEATEARDRLDALLEFAPAFIIALTRDGTIDFINRTLPHHSKKECVGTSWLVYFPPERQALMTEKLRAMYESGETQLFEAVTHGPDGESVWFDSHLAPIREDGQIAGAVLVSQEVTARKREQAELVASRHMALLGTLAAGVAHEINTPIQYVGDNLQFLRDASSDLLALIGQLRALRDSIADGTPLAEAIDAGTRAEEDADLPYIRENLPAAFEKCIEGLQRVTRIVRSLKEFAHPSDQESAEADLNRAIESTLAIATNEYKYVAELEMDLGDLPPVRCHINEISQAVLNIVVNAAHAIGDAVRGTDRKGLITVRTAREGGFAVVTIRDTGGGIPEAIRSRVFDPFFTTKEVGKGTGQGLAIAWSTVKERHGGELSFETIVGTGTTFRLRLPIAGRKPAP